MCPMIRRASTEKKKKKKNRHLRVHSCKKIDEMIQDPI
jgi:hypothetical protein